MRDEIDEKPSKITVLNDTKDLPKTGRVWCDGWLDFLKFFSQDSAKILM